MKRLFCPRRANQRCGQKEQISAAVRKSRSLEQHSLKPQRPASRNGWALGFLAPWAGSVGGA